MTNICRLGLGTAQFGLTYGVSNTSGKTPLPEVKLILEYAKKVGLRLLDTAPAYGEAETVLGHCLTEDKKFQIVTKIPSCSNLTHIFTELEIERKILSSLQAIGQQSFYGVLFHDVGDILSPKGEILWNSLLRLKEKGLTQKIGVSVYAPEEAEQLLQRFSIDIIQIPVNVFDQRFLNQGLLHNFKQTGIEVHARSCFLQGLLLMEPNLLSNFFYSTKDRLEDFRKLSLKNGVRPLDSALAFVFSIKELDKIIVGVNSLVHLKEIVRSLTDKKQPEVMALDFKKLSINDPKMVEPRRWPQMR